MKCQTSAASFGTNGAFLTVTALTQFVQGRKPEVEEMKSFPWEAQADRVVRILNC